MPESPILPSTCAESPIDPAKAAVGANAEPQSSSEVAPPTMPLSPGGSVADAATAAPTLGRYQVIGELGKGGMGVVLLGRDPDLGRELALKVLRGDGRDHPELVERFIEEAQITGQLQHPGIVSVHELSRSAGTGPFIAMRLVKGHTLSQLLAGRAAPGAELPRFLTIFEQVCQALAYAHSRGVIHRDLKPSNIMVDKFGEVQVVDWGLAKVLPATSAPPPEPGVTERSVVATLRNSQVGLETQADTLLGTPAYIPPEQANGEIPRVDERADVFGLGSVLCQILTGQPPYSGRDAREILRRAQRGELADAFARLDGCGADVELVRLCKDCLMAQREDRPRDAGMVAERVTAYRASVEERLRQAQLERAAAQARVASERRVRQRTVALAAALLALVLGGAVLAWQHADRLRIVETDLADAIRALERADWPAAHETLQRADVRLAGGGPEELRQRARRVRLDLDIVEKLEDIRLIGDQVSDERQTREEMIQAYRDAFREHGLDVETLSAEESVSRIQGSPIKTQLIAALDHWALSRLADDRAGCERLLAVTRLADPDDWRQRLRDAIPGRDKRVLEQLAERAEDTLPPVTAILLADTLDKASASLAAVRFLRKAQQQHPNDFWINSKLAHCLYHLGPRRFPDAVSYYRAALALRPRSAWTYNDLSVLLADLGKPEEAVAVCRKAIELKSDYALAYCNLAFALDKQGKLDEAIACCRKALEIKPDYAFAHVNLGGGLFAKGKLDEAIAACRKALAIRPDYAFAYYNIGSALAKQHKLEEAVAAYRKAIELKPDYANAYNNLGNALVDQGKPDEASAAYRKALELKPYFARAHYNLGNILMEQGKRDEAVAAFRKAIEWEPGDADAYNNLGNTLAKQNKLPDAIAAYRQAIALKPNYVLAYNGLGVALFDRGKWADAIVAYREAIRRKPDYAEAHSNLGNALFVQGQRDDAVLAYRKAIELKPDFTIAHYNLGRVLLELNKWEDAVAAYHKAIDLKPNRAIGAEAFNNLAFARQNQGKLDDAIAAYRTATKLNPRLVNAHLNLGVALEKQGKADEALAAFRQAVEVSPTTPVAYSCLGNCLTQQGDLAEALIVYRKAVERLPSWAEGHYQLGLVLGTMGRWREAEAETAFGKAIALKPDFAEAHCRLARTRAEQGRFRDALQSIRRGHQLGSERPGWSIPAAKWMKDIERQIALDDRLPAILKGKARSAGAEESAALAEVCACKRLCAASARFCADAFTAKAALADDLKAGHRYRAACMAAQAGCGQGKDAAKLDDKERARWRRQALDWLRADLVARSKQIDNGTPAERAGTQAALRHWQTDADLAGLRDTAALVKLPVVEWSACLQLWSDVAALLAKAQPGRYGVPHW